MWDALASQWALELAENRPAVVISLDGLEPEGAQEQLWLVREVLTDTMNV